MGFLKSLVVGVSLFVSACTGNPAQKTRDEAPAVATPAAKMQPSTEVAKTLPSFLMLDANGNTVDLQRFKGKKLFVNLWATWCPPCRAEMPSIEKLYQAADKENTQFVLLSLDNDFEAAKKYVAVKGLKVPVFYPAADLPDLFAVNGIPATFIFDEAGNLKMQYEGSNDYNTADYRKLFGAAR